VLVVLGAMLAMMVASRGLSTPARLFPMGVAGAGVVLAVLELIRQARTRGAKEAQDFSDLGGDEGPGFAPRGLLHFAWVAGYLGLVLLIGAMPATALYLVAYLRYQHGEPWRLTLLLATSALATLWLLGLALRLRWPEPLLFG